MTRDQLIETMARAMCRAKWFGIFPVSILNEKVEGFWKMEVVNVIAALTAIEAAGMRVVPAVFPNPTCDPRFANRAAQEDSTSE